MKIAMICTEKLPVPPVAGGAIQLYINGILPIISKYHDITVFCVQHPDLVNEETVEGIRFIRVPASGPDDYIKNVKDKLTDEYELVYVFNRPLWVLELSQKMKNSKFILSLHNEMFELNKITPQKAEQCIARVSCINTVSKFIADGVSKLYPSASSKLNVIYSGADISAYTPSWTQKSVQNKKQLKQKYDIEDYKVILYVGRLSPKKGTHIVLKAMKEVMEVNSNAALVIVGSKWYGKNEEDDFTRSLREISQSLTGPIIFTGFIPPSDIPQIYNIGDIFVCASQWNEPLARVHYEAMAAGLPIITTQRGGNSEVINNDIDGIIIEKYNSPSAFKEAILNLLNNPKKCMEMGKMSRKAAVEKYSFKRVAEDVLRVISKTEKDSLSIKDTDNTNEEIQKEPEQEYILPDF